MLRLAKAFVHEYLSISPLREYYEGFQSIVEKVSSKSVRRCRQKGTLDRLHVKARRET